MDRCMPYCPMMNMQMPMMQSPNNMMPMNQAPMMQMPMMQNPNNMMPMMQMPMAQNPNNMMMPIMQAPNNMPMMDVEAEENYMMEMYPDDCKKMMPYVTKAVEKMEKKDEMFHTKYIDRDTLDKMTDDIYADMTKEMPEMMEEQEKEVINVQRFGRRRFGRNLLFLLLLNELRRRRRRRYYDYYNYDYDFYDYYY